MSAAARAITGSEHWPVTDLARAIGAPGGPEMMVARIGVDESGKGDFFGPLCIAGVYVNEKVCRVLEEAGVRDSKRITSDKRIAALTKAIQEAPGCVWS